MNVDALQKAREAGEVFIHYPVAGRGKRSPLREGKIAANDDTESDKEFGFAIAGLPAAVVREVGGVATVYVLYQVDKPAVCFLWIGPLDILTEYVEELGDVQEN